MTGHTMDARVRTLLLLGTGVAVLWGLKEWDPFHIKSSAVVGWVRLSVYHPIVARFKDLVLNPVSLAAIGFILLLQRLIPAKPQQQVFSASVAQDVVFVVLDAVTKIVVVASYVAFLRVMYEQHLSFLTLTPLWSWPAPLRLGLGILAADWVFWLHHYVRHAVPWFWEFHAVHHSQKEINLFTDDRYHFIEYVVENTFNVLILSICTVDAVTIVGFQLFRKWYTRLYHSNIKSNLGLLKYVLVTPQSHRVHHSIEARHRDKNFGVLFSVWDHLFGTQWRGYNDYPETGIADETFPHETAAGWGLVRTTLAQHLYPFKRIGRELFARVG